VLASFGEGLELPVVVPVAPFFIAAPPVVVLLFISSHTSVPRPVPARRHVAIVTDDAVSTAASGVQVCRRAVFP
jgi:hypothetical protein